MNMPTTSESSATTHPLADRVLGVPHSPGVYLFKNREGEVLYVGKARDLKKRVSNYFRSVRQQDIKTGHLMAKAHDLEYVVTGTEKEALLLESSLIKKHRPRYNIILRDDKNYPALRIDLHNPFPRLEIVRRFKKDGALYFGPYPSALAVRETLHLLNHMFPLRHCKSKQLQPRRRPCLNYSLGRCLGACAGKVTQEEYYKAAEEVVLFLRGKTDVLQQQLKEHMLAAAAAEEYERAALYRDRLQAIATTLEKQHVFSSRFADQDVLGMHQDAAGTELAVLFIRQGVLVGQRSFDLHEARGGQRELITAFIEQYYGGDRFVPEEIIVPTALEETMLLEEWLSEFKGRRVRILAAQRGDRRHLLQLARENARERLLSRRKWQEDSEETLERLQSVFHLPQLPHFMACVDISNLQGRYAVGSVVVFRDGKPDKSRYRRYRVRELGEPDDPAMMAEIVNRFLDEEAEIASDLDLLILDGGKGQLNRIHHLLQQRELSAELPLIALAKETEADVGEEGRGSFDKVFLPGRKNPQYLNRIPDVLHLLQRIRDEAHRFAISYYQKRHRTEHLASILDTLPGIGPKRRRLLIKTFGSLENLRQASHAELEAVPGIPAALARSIFESLHGNDGVGSGAEETKSPED
jgi:excinuclease ABC subunit C